MGMSLHLHHYTALLTLCSMSVLTACDEPSPKPSTTSEDSAVSASADSRPDASVSGKHDAAVAVADAAVADAPVSDAGTKPIDTAQPDAGELKTDYQAWEARVAKLRSCGVLDDGVYRFDPRLDQRCLSLCMIAASCEDLKSEACIQEAVPSIEACFDKCDLDVASCGDGETVPADSVCDLAKDCSDGEDEKHCETFTCKSGSHIAATSLCDGEMDCDDESDEQGCALICGKPYAVSL